MGQIKNIQPWADDATLVSGYTTRAFGSLSARCDPLDVVDQRYLALARELRVDPASLFTLPQTHSTNVAIFRNRDFLARRDGRRSIPSTDPDIRAGSIVIDTADFDMNWQSGVDGVILATEGVFAVTLTADCAPVMFHVPGRRICGVAHAGLVGAINLLPVRMLELFRTEFDIAPDQVDVAILPSIRSCHYNLARSGVWQRLRRAITGKYGADNPHYASGFFDLPGFIRWQLEANGVRSSHIVDLGVCTVCRSQEFFSHVQAGVTGTQEKEGRFGSMIGMKSPE